MLKNSRLQYFSKIFLIVALVQISSVRAEGEEFNLKKISRCVACHGADGIGKADRYPSLQGLPVDYMMNQLKAFKSGTRKNSEMNVVAKSLVEEDFYMFAYYFNQVR